jgi:hypothetical protein
MRIAGKLRFMRRFRFIRYREAAWVIIGANMVTAIIEGVIAAKVLLLVF